MRVRGFVRHVPNLVTAGRALLAIPCLALLSVSQDVVVVRVAAALFVSSMALDVVDGWLARSLKAESVLGRIMDPVLDKVVICGCLVLCIAVSRGLLAPWMVVVVLARELSVSALRGYIESQGVSFKATVWGKVKTASQCLAITAILVYGGLRGYPQWARIVGGTLVWVMMAVVVYSGADYALRACRIIPQLAESDGEGGGESE